MSENWNLLRPQIEFLTQPFPADALAFANRHRDEIAPYLIEALIQVAADPSISDNVDYMLTLYAMNLLAAWRDTRAYAPLLAIGHLDEETVEIILGDSVTEEYYRCLASVCGGDLAPLKSLFEDTQAGHWSRQAALHAWAVRVFAGDNERDELIRYLIAHGDAEAQRLRSCGVGELEAIDSIVMVATDIGASEMLERIERWFDEELLDPMFADKPWVQKNISASFEECRAREGNRLRYVESAENEMSWWACFQEPAQEKSAPPMPMTPPNQPIRQIPPIQPIQAIRSTAKIGRNDPCPCGSGKKYKKCHGVN